MAECHPVGFQWVMEAKRKGARVIHIDPRFTRTSAVADQHVALRAGSDIVFLGGIIHYILEQEKYFRDYVLAYTNAADLISPDFVDTEDLDGLFSGYDQATGTYDRSSWAYQTDEDGRPKRDETLTDPQCVLQILRRHYERYTPEVVEQACGVSQRDFLSVCEAVTENSGRDRTTAWVYSVGWTQHTVGVQYIRTAAIVQSLLGNMGRPGGGIMALRGHASIQGSTDIPTLFDILPGYLPMPKVGLHNDLTDYVASVTTESQKGYWRPARAYTVSLLKSWFGDAATADNDYCFGYLPKISGDHGTYNTVTRMLDDQVDGYFIMGENPAVGSAHGRMQRLGMAHLKWMVVRDFQVIESATWWKDGPEVRSGELRTEDIATEVFFMPAASHVEKEGTFTQTQRMLQWHHKAIDPPQDARSELHFIWHLGNKIRARLADSTDERDRPILDLTWDYGQEGTDEPSADHVLREINGWHLEPDGTPGAMLSSFTEMKDDGSTTGGCWIYTGVYADGVNQSARRKPGQAQSWVAPEWGWAWPANRRILYNRASADPQGRPWSENKAYVWWDEQAGKWTGHDVPDFPADRDPAYRPDPGMSGAEGLAGDDPFIMNSDGKAWLFAPTGLLDGPLPAHYEPQESPVRNPLYRQQSNPTRQVMKRKENLSNPSAGVPGSDEFPYVFTTYRLTEHHTAGGMSRWLPYLSELQPQFFCEVSPALAAERDLTNGGWATIITARTAVEARVLVTDRIQPLTIDGKTVHQVGLPYHWGQGGKGAVVEGDSANDLIGLTLDPNVHIQEAKAGTCDVRPGRRPDNPQVRHLVEDYISRAGITVETGNTLHEEGDPS